MEKKKPKKVFIDGPISPEKIANSIASHQSKTDILEHSIFLEQAKQKEVNGTAIGSIDYSVNEGAVEDILHEIREGAFTKFNLSCLHMYHSIGKVQVGEISFFVFTSSPNKNEAGEACSYLVSEFRSKVQVVAKERMQG